ncbi:MAG: response regulator transcription factor [Acidobacteria bacterium]|nr:response regulator transcription factor [Acidobacteriota bacterium]
MSTEPSTGPSPVRKAIALVSNDEFCIAGLTAILSESTEPQSNPIEIVSLSMAGALRSGAIHIVLIDAGSTDHLFELIATFRRSRPSLKLIVLADEADGSDPAYIERVIGAGAKGVLSATATADELRLALRIVEDGSIWAPRKVLSRLLDARSVSRRPAGASEAMRFTMRENQVIRLLVDGRSNRDIGETLGIDAGSVKAHIGRMMRKVGVSNRIELTMYALNQYLERD